MSSSKPAPSPREGRREALLLLPVDNPRLIMATRSIDSRFLANGMRAFLVALEHAERTIAAGSDPSVDSDSLTRPENLRTVLSAEIDHALRASERHGFLPGSPAITQTRVVIARVADCRLLALDWIGHDAWRDQPLSSDELPEIPAQTSGLAADDVVATSQALVEQAQALLDETSELAPSKTGRSGPERAALAEVYLLALALLPTSAEDDDRQPPGVDAALITSLLATIASERGDAGERPDPLFTEAYRHTQRRGTIPHLPNPLGWQLTLALVATALLLSTFVLWFRATASLREPVLDLLRLLGT